MSDAGEGLDDGPFIVCDKLVKIYQVADLEVVALQGLDLTVRRGELMAIIGNSGSGKTTLMNILGGLDRPTAGTCTVYGLDLGKAGESDARRSDQNRHARSTVRADDADDHDSL